MVTAASAPAGPVIECTLSESEVVLGHVRNWQAHANEPVIAVQEQTRLFTVTPKLGVMLHCPVVGWVAVGAQFPTVELGAQVPDVRLVAKFFSPAACVKSAAILAS